MANEGGGEDVPTKTVDLSEVVQPPAEEDLPVHGPPLPPPHKICEETGQVSISVGDVHVSHPDFIVAPHHEGPMPGYTLKDGPKGAGYYRDLTEEELEALEHINDCCDDPPQYFETCENGDVTTLKEHWKCCFLGKMNKVDTNYGDTALHKAAKFGRDEIARFVLAYNADITIKNKQGKTAEEIDRHMSVTRIIKKYRLRRKKKKKKKSSVKKCCKRLGKNSVFLCFCFLYMVVIFFGVYVKYIAKEHPD